MPKLQQNIPIGLKAITYLALKAKAKQIENETAEVRVDLEKHIEVHGVKNEKGHITAITDHDGIRCELKQECRVYASLVEEAEEILKKSLPEKTLKKLFEKQTTVVFHQEVLTTFIADGTIPEEVAEKLFVSKDNYAFKVKKL